MTGENPQISIIIPVYGGAWATRACLDSIHRHTDLKMAELLLVDDASPDKETQDLLSELDQDKRLKVFRQMHNGGFANACNLGIRSSKADLVLLLNNDTEVQEGWLEPLLQAFKDPGVGAAGSLLLYPGGKIIQHAGIELVREGNELKPFHIGQFQRAAHTLWALEDRDVPAITGACLAFRRVALPGGAFLDEAYRNGYEDTDFGLRLGHAGWRIRYCGSSRVFHHESIATGRFSSEDGNRRVFQERWKAMPGSLSGKDGHNALNAVRARQSYLLKPDPAHASRVARASGTDVSSEEIQLWQELSRGRILPWKRLTADQRHEIHRLLEIETLSIRR